MDNLLIITFDQLRGDWLNKNNSPTIDRLAKSGMVASRCYTSSPHCMPARWSWITGQRPSKLNITRNIDKDMNGEERSIIRNVKNKGVNTAIIGKTHWTSHKNPVDLRSKEGIIKDLGFNYVLEIAGPKAMRHVECDLTDEWRKNNFYEAYKEDMVNRYSKGLSSKAWQVKETPLPNYLYPDIWVKTRAVEYLKNMDYESPWLLWVSFVGPHEPFDTPPPWKGMSKSVEQQIMGVRKKWLNKLEAECGLTKISKKWESKINYDHIEDLRLDYNDRIQLLDDQVRDLLKAIKMRKETGNTKVLITSDHGEMLGDYGMLYKSTFLEPAIRVPFIFYDPKECSGVNINNPVGLTSLLKKATEKYCNKYAKRELTNWITKQKGAIVEYEDETAFIMGDRKLIFNRDAKELWGTKIIGIKENFRVKRESKRWERLRSWGINDLRRQN